MSSKTIRAAITASKTTNAAIVAAIATKPNLREELQQLRTEQAKTTQTLERLDSISSLETEKEDECRCCSCEKRNSKGYCSTDTFEDLDEDNPTAHRCYDEWYHLTFIGICEYYSPKE